MKELYDKNKRDIRIDDILKVQHGEGDFYDYKIVTGIKEAKNGRYIEISHLPMHKGGYELLMDNSIQNKYEIVCGWREGLRFDRRPILGDDINSDNSDKPQEDTEPYQERVVQEKAELDVKIESLQTFMDDPDKIGDISINELCRLAHQLKVMQEYSEVLGERIANF